MANPIIDSEFLRRMVADPTVPERNKKELRTVLEKLGKTPKQDKGPGCLRDRRYHGCQNQLELDYADLLEADRRALKLSDWSCNAVKIKLANGAWYMPDFLVIRNDGTVELHETKGFWREAAKVRIKVASSMYPGIQFIVVTRKNGQWRYERF